MRQEAEARKLRAQLDDTQHTLASERATATLRVADAARDAERRATLHAPSSWRHSPPGQRLEAGRPTHSEEYASRS